MYSENMRIVESLARTYGFTAVYVWQPTIHGTRKQLTPFEAQLMASIKQDPLQARLRQVHLIVPSLLDTLMASVAPGRFVNASSAFERDTLPVFSDQIGHNTEEAIPPIVDTFWPVLRTAVSAKLAKAKLAGDSLRAARSAPTTRTSGSAAR